MPVRNGRRILMAGPSRTSTATYVLVFVLLAAGIGAAGARYYGHQRADLRARTLRELSAVAELKVAELVAWRRERLANAQVLVTNPYNARGLPKLLAGAADPGTRAEFARWLEDYRRRYEYRSIVLLDASGAVCVAVPEGFALDPAERARVLSARPGEASFSDFYRAGSTVLLSVFAPVPKPSAADGKPAGYLVLVVDPETFLYPYIQRWPTPSRTAETLLVEREGDQVLYLNELRHVRGTALTLRLPLSPGLPAAAGVQGRSTTMEGRDYRGEPVLAAVGPIPESPWGLVSKVDQAEVYAPLRQSAQLVGLVVAALLAGAGGLLLFLSTRQTARLYRREALALGERDRERAEATRQQAILAAVLEQMPVGVIVVDGGGRVIWGNPQMARIWSHPVPAGAWIPGHEYLRGFRPDGTPMDPEEWPIARSLATGEAILAQRIPFERGDGVEASSRLTRPRSGTRRGRSSPPSRWTTTSRRTSPRKKRSGPAGSACGSPPKPPTRAPGTGTWRPVARSGTSAAGSSWASARRRRARSSAFSPPSIRTTGPERRRPSRGLWTPRNRTSASTGSRGPTASSAGSSPGGRSCGTEAESPTAWWAC